MGKNNKINFANTILELGDNAFLTTDECFKYGNTWGCDLDCPVFSKGECKIEDIDAFKKMVLESNLESSELNNVYNMYPKLK